MNIAESASRFELRVRSRDKHDRYNGAEMPLCGEKRHRSKPQNKIEEHGEGNKITLPSEYIPSKSTSSSR